MDGVDMDSYQDMVDDLNEVYSEAQGADRVREAAFADIDIQKARECLLDFRERFIAFAQLAAAKDLFNKEWVVFEPVNGAGVLIDDALKALGLVIGEPPVTPDAAPVPDAPAGDDLDSMAWITSLANGRQHDAVD